MTRMDANSVEIRAIRTLTLAGTPGHCLDSRSLASISGLPLFF
jgi:hypothetical protein